MKPVTITIAAVLALTVGCIPSLHPLFTPKDLVFDPALIGVWSEDDEETETWQFQRVAGNGKSYRLSIRDDEGRTADMRAHLVKLNDRLYLDMVADSLGESPTGEISKQMNEYTSASLIRGHLIARVWQIVPELKMTLMNSDFMTGVFNAEPEALAHIGTQQEGFVITASTKELQAFIIKHADNEKLFERPDGTGMKRREKLAAHTNPVPELKKR